MGLAQPKAPARQRTQGTGHIETRLQGTTTRVIRRFQEGAFKARVLQPHAQTHADIALINTAGGLTGGDTMALSIHNGPGTSSAISTQACEKFYRAGGGITRVNTSLRLAESSTLHWVPQEAILFNQSHADRRISVDMHPSARLLLAESILLGRCFSGESFDQGTLKDSWSITSAGRLVHTERLRLQASKSSPLSAAAKMGKFSAMSTLLLVAQNADDFIGPVRRLISQMDCRGGASSSTVNGAKKLLVRLLAKDGYELRKTLVPLMAILGDGRTLPRLWNT